ncbi:MAG: dTDP-4-amino-4,6-dideoxygalactose transaminase [Flavobacteriales bacterium]|nr:dTDP-4-amino-4,6-dideoxygalactose transaminase [Flavobacteriales bacterium]MBQ21012.1 dTDP-4-amino-4,6-dideoxygalactose transaminase [Flavobacteriales bacterium]|tara:strand:+ start:83768 stop:84910 length:1143 start_codon:yes stop_codon:yes gene_type:complete
MIKFNKPYITGKELLYIEDAINRGELSGDGYYTAQCSKYFSSKFGFNSNFLTTSGTDALEMAAILSNISEGDEVIMPSFTFVSTANAFILRGATIKFVDSQKNSPNMDEDLIEALITEKTKAIVVVHYGGIACDMEKIISLSEKYNLIIIEDAAHSIDSYYKNQPLGSIGHFGAFSFHSTKNIISGEGGMMVVNDKNAIKRAEIIREKGTNRSSFFRGEIDKYGWVDIGSSFLPSEVTAAFLYAQLEDLDSIQTKRKEIWNDYYTQLKSIEQFYYQLPVIPDYATNNAHLFYIICPSIEKRTALINYLLNHNIKAVFHYQALHKSSYYLNLLSKTNQSVKPLKNAERYSDLLLRLPLFPDLSKNDINLICKKIIAFIRES